MADARDKTNNKKQLNFLATCLFIIALASSIAAGIQTDWGRVQVRSITLPTENGQWLVADLFKPVSATAEKPAPFIVVIPGFQRSKEALSNIALELARRGFVTATIDPYAQGSSSASMSRRAATTQGYGMFALVDYAANTGNMNYIDKTRIGATGHSAGGNAAIRGANYFGRESSRTGESSKLHSVFVSGYVLTLTDEVLEDVRSNVGVSYALYDEGAFRNELNNGDMRFAPEALRTVNWGIGDGAGPVSEVEIGRFYGSTENRSTRVVFNEHVIHPFQPYSGEASANQISYFETVFDMPSKLSNEDQVWQWKEFFSLVSMIAAMVALVPMARILLNTSLFRSLAGAMPVAPPQPNGSGRLLFWGLFVTGAVIACISFIPMAELSQQLFVDASSRRQTWFFPQRMNNAVMMWAVFNGTIGFLIFFMSYYVHGRKKGTDPAMWGGKTHVAELAKTLLLAVCLFTAYYLILFFVYYVLHVDYRFWFMGVRPFQAEMLLLLLMYAPFFFIFFLSNSLRVNGSIAVAGRAEWKTMLIGGIGNSLGLIFIVLVQYITFASTGTVYWTDSWLYVNLLFAVIPMMFVLPYFNRYFFRMTGKIYLGPMVTTLIFIMILLSNTVCYIPLG
ncbi:MAG: hypothetical protein V7711_17890 [Pseudomonadales bacterium]